MIDVVKEKASIFLKSVFLKIGANDTTIQIEVSNIFLPVITEIMRTVPYSNRVAVLSPLLACISYFIAYKEKIHKEKKLTKLKEFDGLNTFIIDTYTQFAKALLEGLRTKGNCSHSGAAKSIINSVFISELACDLGDKVIQYRKAQNTNNADAVERLENDIKLLLNDYNEVSGETPLTFQDIINKSGEINE